MNAKLSETHLHRRAVIYLRQSTLKQVVEHTESTRRQYGLRDRALALGWAAEGIEIIDEDLGRSGTSAEGRSGFRRLSEGVAHGSVGAIFALDVSRLVVPDRVAFLRMGRSLIRSLGGGGGWGTRGVGAGRLCRSS